MNDAPLNLAQEQFLNTLLADPQRNQTQAYMAVYNCSYEAAGVSAARLMQDPRIVARVEAFENALRKRSHMTADRVLQELGNLASADARDLIDYRRGACRYCHGAHHYYQMKPQEYRDRMAAYQKATGGKDPMGLEFDYKGGVGFNVNAAPHPDCPECDGNGVGYTYARDLRTVSPAAARLIAGIKETKDGFEIKTRDQNKALELIAKNLGLLRDNGDNEGQNIPPAGTVVYEVEDGRKAPPDAKA